MTWKADDPKGNESLKIKYHIVPYTRGRGLDLGCGDSKTYQHFIGVDNYKDMQLFGTPVKPDVVCDVTDLSMFATGSMDFVFSSYLLEHIEDYQAALKEWWRVIKPDGYLVLYLPHKDLYPNIGQPGANPDHKHDFLPEDIIKAMEAFDGWDLVENETRGEDREYSFYQVFRKLESVPTAFDVSEDAKSTWDGGKRSKDWYAKWGNRHRHSWKDPKPQNTVCIVRYGGYGDQIQASSILPELKRQGWHITFMTTPQGKDILEHDPHVDAWILQDKDQVPNVELSAYWSVWQKKFIRFINLSESIEGTLLAIPGRANHGWPDEVRQKELNHNYGEWTAALSRVPYRSEGKFYPSKEETEWAKAYLGDGAFHIVWVLSGSSVHKFYPNMDQVIGRVLNEAGNVHITFVGDYACKLLESGWEKHKQISCKSGELTIRQSLSLAKYADCVVGPETGVLNSVAFETNAKVILLSHSSHENLTKHWINTAVLVPSVPCYPCHRLHYGREFCPEDKPTGASICAVSIPPEHVSSYILNAVDRWKKEAA